MAAMWSSGTGTPFEVQRESLEAGPATGAVPYCSGLLGGLESDDGGGPRDQCGTLLLLWPAGRPGSVPPVPVPVPDGTVPVGGRERRARPRASTSTGTADWLPAGEARSYGLRL